MLPILKWPVHITGLQVSKTAKDKAITVAILSNCFWNVFHYSKLYFSLYFVAGPSTRPAYVRGNSMSSTSIFVQWDQVPSRYQNGVILYYTVTYYRAYYDRFPQTVIVAAPTTQVTLTGLSQGTLYSITVSASTGKGRGPYTYISIATGKNTEFPVCLLGVNGEKRTTTTKKEKKTLIQ